MKKECEVTYNNQHASYENDGYIVVRQLFSCNEVDEIRNHYMRLRETASYPLDNKGIDTDSNDPILQYPRMTHMQRWDPASLDWLTDKRVATWLTRLLAEDPLLVQGMVYFKPPQSRGQALHQDQFYLKVQPGTCIAMWMALDRSDEHNGCLQLVPGSSKLPVLCTETADTTKSFTDIAVPVPKNMDRKSLIMDPGDVVFFNGSLIHGSHPNTTHDRFRRALTGHYIPASAKKINIYYHPAFKMDGTQISMDVSEGGGPCGIWVDQRGKTVVEMEDRPLSSR